MGVKVKIPYKDLIMVQDEAYGDYEGHCPWCNEIFYVPFEKTKAHPFYRCQFCHALNR